MGVLRYVYPSDKLEKLEIVEIDRKHLLDQIY